MLLELKIVAHAYKFNRTLLVNFTIGQVAQNLLSRVICIVAVSNPVNTTSRGQGTDRQRYEVFY